MDNFDYNIIQKVLEIVEIDKVNSDKVLSDYYGLIKLKGVEIADLTDEDLYEFDESNFDIDKFTTIVSEKYQENPEKTKELENYIRELNIQFMKVISKTATDDQKRRILEYFDEHEQRIQKLLLSDLEEIN